MRLRARVGGKPAAPLAWWPLAGECAAAARVFCACQIAERRDPACGGGVAAAPPLPHAPPDPTPPPGPRPHKLEREAGVLRWTGWTATGDQARVPPAAAMAPAAAASR